MEYAELYTKIGKQMNHKPYVLACQVVYLSGAEYCTKIHLRSGRVDVRARPISDVSQFYPSFIRIHKQYCINPDCLVLIHSYQSLSTKKQQKPPRRSQIRKSYQIQVELISGEKIPVSERKWEEIKDELIRLAPVKAYSKYSAMNQIVYIDDLFPPDAPIQFDTD